MVCTLLPGKKSYGALKIFRLCFFYFKGNVWGFFNCQSSDCFKKLYLKGWFLPQFIECW